MSSLRVEVAPTRTLEIQPLDQWPRTQPWRGLTSGGFRIGELERVGRAVHGLSGQPVPAVVELTWTHNGCRTYGCPAWRSGCRRGCPASPENYLKRVLERLDRGWIDGAGILGAAVLRWSPRFPMVRLRWSSASDPQHGWGRPRSFGGRFRRSHGLWCGCLVGLCGRGRNVVGLGPFLGVLQNWTSGNCGQSVVTGVVAMTGLSARWAVGRYLGAAIGFRNPTPGTFIFATMDSSTTPNAGCTFSSARTACSSSSIGATPWATHERGGGGPQ